MIHALQTKPFFAAVCLALIGCWSDIASGQSAKQPQDPPKAAPPGSGGGQVVDNKGTINGPVIQVIGWPIITVIDAKPAGGDFGVLDVRVMKYQGQKAGAPKGLIEDRPASLLLDVLLLNKSTADGVVSKVRLRCVDYKFEKSGGFGGDDILSVSSVYAANISGLVKKDAVVDIAVAEKVAAGKADRFVVVLNDNDSNDKAVKGIKKWTLAVEIFEGDRIISTKEVKLQIPPASSTPAADDAAMKAVQNARNGGKAVFESTELKNP